MGERSNVPRSQAEGAHFQAVVYLEVRAIQEPARYVFCGISGSASDTGASKVCVLWYIWKCERYRSQQGMCFVVYLEVRAIQEPARYVFCGISGSASDTGASKVCVLWYIWKCERYRSQQGMCFVVYLEVRAIQEPARYVFCGISGSASDTGASKVCVLWYIWKCERYRSQQGMCFVVYLEVRAIQEPARYVFCGISGSASDTGASKVCVLWGRLFLILYYTNIKLISKDNLQSLREQSKSFTFTLRHCTVHTTSSLY